MEDLSLNIHHKKRSNNSKSQGGSEGFWLEWKTKWKKKARMLLETVLYGI